jgi:hypothetical protein
MASCKMFHHTNNLMGIPKQPKFALPGLNSLINKNKRHMLLDTHRQSCPSPVPLSDN